MLQTFLHHFEQIARRQRHLFGFWYGLVSFSINASIASSRISGTRQNRNENGLKVTASSHHRGTWLGLLPTSACGERSSP